MKLTRIFSLREDAASLDRNWARQLIARYDPGVGQVLSEKGLNGLVFRGSNQTVWKISDNEAEAEVARSISGKDTKTLVPVLQVLTADEPDPIDGGTLFLIQTKLLRDLDPVTAAVAGFYTEEGDFDMDEGDIRRAAARLHRTVPEIDQAVSRFDRWVRYCQAEAAAYGLDPDIFAGMDNIKLDADGNLRLVDLG